MPTSLSNYLPTYLPTDRPVVPPNNIHIYGPTYLLRFASAYVLTYLLTYHLLTHWTIGLLAYYILTWPSQPTFQNSWQSVLIGVSECLCASLLICACARINYCLHDCLYKHYTKGFRNARNCNTLESALQHELHNVVKWKQENHFHVNTNKKKVYANNYQAKVTTLLSTSILHLCTGNIPIESEAEHKVLGATNDRHLAFNSDL